MWEGLLGHPVQYIAIDHDLAIYPLSLTQEGHLIEWRTIVKFDTKIHDYPEIERQLICR
jgi:hypothetical protein